MVGDKFPPPKEAAAEVTALSREALLLTASLRFPTAFCPLFLSSLCASAQLEVTVSRAGHVRRGSAGAALLSAGGQLRVSSMRCFARVRVLLVQTASDTDDGRGFGGGFSTTAVPSNSV